jgi:Family of unknown function (DUF5994)
MATVANVSTLDQTDLARLDDDGGPAPRIRSRRSRQIDGDLPVAGGGPRLSMSPVRGRDDVDNVDGAWWPRTVSLAGELPGLITALSTGDVISRVSVNGHAWSDIPDRVAQRARPAVRVSWFMTLDPHVITLGRTTGPRIRLLVIPPAAAPGPARVLLRRAATGRIVGLPGEVLRAFGAGG